MLLKQIVQIGYHIVERIIQCGHNFVIWKHVKIIPLQYSIIQIVKIGYLIVQ